VVFDALTQVLDKCLDFLDQLRWLLKATMELTGFAGLTEFGARAVSNFGKEWFLFRFVRFCLFAECPPKWLKLAVQHDVFVISVKNDWLIKAITAI